MSAPPAWQFYGRDFFVATRTLGAFGRGIYIDLLILEWENGPIDDDPEAVAKLCGEDLALVTHIWPLLRAKFTDEGAPPGKMINRRLEEVRQKQRVAHAARVSSGKAGAQKKYGPKLVKP